MGQSRRLHHATGGYFFTRHGQAKGLIYWWAESASQPTSMC